MKDKSRNLAGYGLFGLALTIEVAVLFFGGSPQPFYTTPFKALYFALTVLFALIAIVLCVRREMLAGFIHFFIAIFLIFYGVNEALFVWEELPAKNINSVSKDLIKGPIRVLAHEHGDSERLKNQDSLTMLYGGKLTYSSLNHPARFEKDVKLLVTGDGETVLVTQSVNLDELTVMSLLIAALLGLFAFARRSR